MEEKDITLNLRVEINFDAEFCGFLFGTVDFAVDKQFEKNYS